MCDIGKTKLKVIPHFRLALSCFRCILRNSKTTKYKNYINYIIGLFSEFFFSEQVLYKVKRKINCLQSDAASINGETAYINSL